MNDGPTMSAHLTPLRVERRHDGATLHLTLNRPKANIIDLAMMEAIEGALDAHLEPSVKAVVFEGAGPHFSFGASVAEHTAERAAEMLARFHGLFRRLADETVPTVALVRGQCLGGGMELASWCTWIVASPDAHFGQPEIKLAVFPPMASLLLPWRVGGGRAADLCVSGRSIDAALALHVGLISAIAEDPAAWWCAFFDEHLADRSAAALRFADRAVRADLLASMDERLDELEHLYLDELMGTHDANEGIAAFLEKRPPRFEHR